MPLPGHTIETLQNPAAYSKNQVVQAMRIARAFQMPTLILAITPALCVRCFGAPETYCTRCGEINDD